MEGDTTLWVSMERGHETRINPIMNWVYLGCWVE